MRDGAFEAGAFAFRSVLKDFIVRVPAPSISPTAFTKENADDDGWMHGAELYARYVLCDTWTVWADVAYAFGKVDQFENGVTDEEPLGKLPPTMGHVGVRYAPKNERYWLEIVATAMRHQERLSPGDETDTQRIPPGGTPGFTVWTVRGGYRLMDDIHATLSIENVTDKSYRYHGSGTNEPGTNVIAALDVRF
jgi:hemoglobin/transferrin/lactoferrin receptor protein